MRFVSDFEQVEHAFDARSGQKIRFRKIRLTFLRNNPMKRILAVLIFLVLTLSLAAGAALARNSEA